MQGLAEYERNTTRNARFFYFNQTILLAFIAVLLVVLYIFSLVLSFFCYINQQGFHVICRFILVTEYERPQFLTFRNRQEIWLPVRWAMQTKRWIIGKQVYIDQFWLPDGCQKNQEKMQFFWWIYDISFVSPAFHFVSRWYPRIVRSHNLISLKYADSH